MKRYIRKFVPNALVNYGRHLPTAFLANLRYGFPSKGLKIIGVTGTDGKTTTTNMVYQILKHAGKKASMVSTINAEIGGVKEDTGFHVTNPDPLALQRYIRKARDRESEYLVLEVTSHGLDQFRTWGINFDVGVITNITHEHLDYHQSFENYLLAKAKLIRGAKVAVLNNDQEIFERLKKLSAGKVVSFGLKSEADFNPLRYPLKLKIPGEYNLLNALSATAACVNLGIEPFKIKEALEDFQGLEGRMEVIPNELGIKIVVDFAHTPAALENALKVLKKETKGRLISIFGAAAERDTGKRPLMGEISAKLADITILTDEDPRFDVSLNIINEIAVGAEKAGAKFEENLFKEPDRLEAIIKGIRMAKKGDTVGIFGKGHEKSMNYKGREIEWSDQEAVRKVLHEQV